MRKTPWFAGLLLVAACASVDPGPRTACSRDGVTIDADFEGGAFYMCTFQNPDSVVIEMRPEDDKVSGAFSWFAFRATSGEPREIDVELTFPDSYARFWPKISDDGERWRRAAEDTVEYGPRKESIRFRMTADADGTWASSQELLTLPWYETWLAELDAHPELTTRVFGNSTEGRPITLAESDGNSAAKLDAVVLIGRQHPAEVPGALAMRAFVTVVLGDTPLARRFRDRYKLVILPLMNPDGVVHGHARHNLGATDLNRDWGPFTQPETRSAAAFLGELDEIGVEPRLMLDFHATRVTPTMIFYTQMPTDLTEPPRFATRWLEAVDARIDDYEFTHDPRPPSGQDNTKNYFFARYGIPAFTYEIGDEADRTAISRYTPIFAEEMMRVMLDAE